MPATASTPLTVPTPHPLAQTPLPRGSSPAAAGYFEQEWPVAVILGSFFAVTLPMMAVELLATNAMLTWAYIWLFGITHFVITLTIYFNSANLSYFASSWKTALTFFAVPVLIFITFDMLHAFRVSATWPVTALVIFGCVRFFDFFHLNRQTFGVLQMFKGRTKAKYPAHLRTRENRYLISFVILLMATFLSGGVCPLLQAGGPLSLAMLNTLEGGVAVVDIGTLQFIWIALAAVTLTHFTLVIRGHRQMAKANPQGKGFGPALAYILFQSFGTAMAALYFPLYLAALAMHYVEYHILMAPRVLRTSLNPESTVDRKFAWLRNRPVLFYVLILIVSAVVAGGAFVGMNAAMGAPIVDFTSPVSSLILLALFDGIFVFHYFVEMFIWKFSDPHFRKLLAGLYFTPAKLA
ncbi:hypothetical protein BH11PLA2_BH11PLA2_05850 [soil metagenome]